LMAHRVDRRVRGCRARAASRDGGDVFARHDGGSAAESRGRAGDGRRADRRANTIDGVSALAGWIAHLGAAAIVSSARLVDVAPWLAFRVPAPSAFTIATYYTGLALLLLMRAARLRIVGLIALVVGALLIVTGVPFERDTPGLRLTMVDVGQGE